MQQKTTRALRYNGRQSQRAVTEWCVHICTPATDLADIARRKSVGRAKSSLRHSATSKWRVIFTTFAVTFDTNIMWLCPKLLCPGLTDSLIYIFMPASVDASKVWWEQVIKALFFAKLIVVIKDCGDRGRRRSAPSMHHFFAACSSLSRDARISSRHLLHQSHLHALQRKLLSCTLNWDYTLLAATHSWWSCELSSVLSLPQIYWLRTLDGTSVLHLPSHHSLTRTQDTSAPCLGQQLLNQEGAISLVPASDLEVWLWCPSCNNRHQNYPARKPETRLCVQLWAVQSGNKYCPELCKNIFE